MTAHAERAPWWLLLMGVPIGFASSLCGIGGGLFAGSLLHFTLGFELKRSTATALVLVFATTTAATITESVRPDSALQLEIVGALLAGVLVGAQLGFVFSERVPERALRAIFAVVLLYSAARILTSDAAGPGGLIPGATMSIDSDLVRIVVAALIGLGGGFAAPVLGVGGGLIMVPGLFLGLGDVSFDTARACSLAAGAVASLRSLVLKHSTGRVHWSAGVRLGIGALVGAAAGVASLGASDGLIEVGRSLLGIVLLVVGVRFCVPRPARSFQSDSHS